MNQFCLLLIGSALIASNAPLVAQERLITLPSDSSVDKSYQYQFRTTSKHTVMVDKFPVSVSDSSCSAGEFRILRKAENTWLLKDRLRKLVYERRTGESVSRFDSSELSAVPFGNFFLAQLAVERELSITPEFTVVIKKGAPQSAGSAAQWLQMFPYDLPLKVGGEWERESAHSDLTGKWYRKYRVEYHKKDGRLLMFSLRLVQMRYEPSPTLTDWLPLTITKVSVESIASAGEMVYDLDKEMATIVRVKAVAKISFRLADLPDTEFQMTCEEESRFDVRGSDK